MTVEISLVSMELASSGHLSLRGQAVRRTGLNGGYLYSEGRRFDFCRFNKVSRAFRPVVENKYVV